MTREEIENAAARFDGSMTCVGCFIGGANYVLNNLWKPADGEDLPEIGREVIVLLDKWNGVKLGEAVRVCFAHRPNPKGWEGKSLTDGNVEHYTPKTYGKGGWNIPDVKYWLDICLPKLDED